MKTMEALIADASTTAAMVIGQSAIDAVFCGFQTTADGKKIPHSKLGKGVAADTDAGALFNASEVNANSLPTGATHWGLVMHHPIKDVLSNMVLTVLDLDTKRSSEARDIRIKALYENAKRMGLLTERSQSRKGGHIFFWANPDADLPGKIKLGNNQEIEIFGHPGSPGKSVMLTGDMLFGALKSVDSVLSLLHGAGISDDLIFHKAAPKKQERTYTAPALQSDDWSKARDALQFIQLSEGDYELWIEIGQSLHGGFGDAGRELWLQWSATQPGFEGEHDIEAHWKSFKGSGRSLGTLFHMARQAGFEQSKKPKMAAFDDFANVIAQEMGDDAGDDASADDLRFEVIKASELPPADFGEVFADELVEGICTKRSITVIYGPSNSGKTFMAIGMGAAVSRGVQWFGRNTSQCAVLYLATESPESVKMRLRAYQHLNEVRLDDFYVIPNPISLYDAKADIEEILKACQHIESMSGKKVGLIFGDTLARLSSGANENSGEDMGVVMNNVDVISRLCSATFVLIHHSGKDTSKGSRGWSGIRAFIDTELEVEVTDNDGDIYRVLKDTKQRDLEGGGLTIPFDIQSVHMGMNQWGKDRSVGVAIEGDMPPPKKMGRPDHVSHEIEQQMLDAMRSGGVGIKVSELKNMLPNCPKSTFYRVLDGLVASGRVNKGGHLVSQNTNQWESQ